MERVAATSGSAPDAPDHEHAFDASPVSLRKDESTSSGRGSVTQGGSKRSKKLAELLALQYPSRCHALPAGDAAVEKVLYFVRHGEATHNVVRETHVGTDNPYLNPALTDAPLTAVGRAQAERLRPAADDVEGRAQSRLRRIRQQVQAKGTALCGTPWRRSDALGSK